MANLDRLFIITGFVFVLIGMSLGLKMSHAQDFLLGGLHAHLNLLGFVSMVLYGLIHKNWPSIRASGLAKIHYLVHVFSISIGFIVLYFVLSDGATYGPMLGRYVTMIFGVTALNTAMFLYLFWKHAKD